MIIGVRIVAGYDDEHMMMSMMVVIYGDAMKMKSLILLGINLATLTTKRGVLFL